MSTERAIAAVDHPGTVRTLTGELRALGLDEGGDVMVHSSLSRLGYVNGGAQAVVLALREVLGPDGTIAMPTHSGNLSDPASWSKPPVPEAWWDTLRREMPAYDPLLTPTRGMGAIVDCFRRLPGARRSSHPTVSVAAAGPNAAFIVGDHSLGGAGSPTPIWRATTGTSSVSARTSSPPGKSGEVQSAPPPPASCGSGRSSTTRSPGWSSTAPS